MSLFSSVGLYDNLDDPEPFFNRKAAIFGFIIPFLTASTICSTLRLYVRFYVTRCPGWDDYFIILIFMLSWVTNVGSLFLVNVGLGRHFIYLGLEGMVEFVHMFWWCNACYNMSMASIKLSLLFQYRRLLNDHPDSDNQQPKFQKIAVTVLLAITAIWGIIYSILAWVPCVPVYADWVFLTKATRYGYGSDDKETFATTFIIHGACNMSIDIAIFALPLFSKSMWATAGRQRQSRLSMIFLYGLGLISVVCSIIRFESIVDTKAATLPTFDPTWYGPTPIVLSILEVDIAAIMASLPVFWPYMRRNIDRIMVTHEIEVKVTEHFTQIDDQGEDGRRGSRTRGEQPDGALGAAQHHHHHTPWMDDDGDESQGGGLKWGENMVMMRPLNRTATGGSMSNDGSPSLPSGDGLPFDGSRSPGGPRSPGRATFLQTRNSKEVLLN